MDGGSVTGLPLVLDLDGEGGNAFVILGNAMGTLKRAGLHDAARDYYAAATAGDYENLLRTTAEYFDVMRPGDPVPLDIEEVI